MNLRLSLLLIICLFSCGTKTNKTTALSTTQNDNKPDVVIGSVSWAQDIAITRLAKKIIESKGYSVQIKEVTDLRESLEAGDIDISITGWYPQNIHVIPSKDLIMMGDTYQNAVMGVVSPIYSTVKSLADLENSDRHKYITIYRPLNGQESALAVNEIMKRYNFKFCNEEQVDSLTAIYVRVQFQQHKDFFVVGGYPHPMFTKKSLKILKDPYHAFEEHYDIVKLCSKKWSEAHPGLYQFFIKFQLDDMDFDKLVEINEINLFQLDVAIEKWYEYMNPQFTNLLQQKEC
ncbi:glycine betaine ABC transporter substrate-binding protein [Prolixibacteraceae bacterium]|nr:glycine betaine ABC transporter substrate-binding protein [Prolixibacteraceae bacterium]